MLLVVWAIALSRLGIHAPFAVWASALRDWGVSLLSRTVRPLVEVLEYFIVCHEEADKVDRGAREEGEIRG